MMRKAILSIAGVMTAAVTAAAVDITPVYKVKLLGGQYFVQGTNSNVTANGSLNVAPVLAFSDRWSFVPHYWFNYQGVKGVGDGVGAGTRWQQQMDHRLSFTGIYNPEGTNWRIKPSMSYRRNFLKETLDETWGRGLFDYDKMSLGLEAENVYNDPFSYRISFDAYRIAFPNYQSLESRTQTDPSGNPLNRELTSRDVLDTFNFRLTFAGSRPFPFNDPVVSLHASLSNLYQVYNDQRIVNRQGQFNANKPYGRQDFMTTLSLGVGLPTRFHLRDREFRLGSNFGFDVSHNGSNQNTFDAARTFYVDDAYSYFSVGGGPSFNLAWGDKKRPATAGVSFKYNHLLYTGRLAQGTNGGYTGSHQWQDNYTLSLGQAYPLTGGFKIVTHANFLWAVSNQAYEKTYMYTYRTANYMMGFTYDY